MPDRHDSAPRTLTKEVSCSLTYVRLAKIERPARLRAETFPIGDLHWAAGETGTRRLEDG